MAGICSIHQGYETHCGLCNAVLRRELTTALRSQLYGTNEVSRSEAEEILKNYSDPKWLQTKA